MQINAAGFAAGSSAIVFACSEQGGVYKSTDGGRHFDRANPGLPNTEAWALPSNSHPSRSVLRRRTRACLITCMPGPTPGQALRVDA